MCDGQVVSQAGQQVTATPDVACTVACTSGAENARAAAGDKPADPDLAAVVEAWDRLPAAVRAGIVAMAKAVAGEQ
jgi:hypothetical protein